MKFNKTQLLKLISGIPIKAVESKVGMDLSVVPKNGFVQLSKKQIKQLLEIKQLEEQIKAGTFHGEGLLKHIKNFGHKVINVIKSHISPVLLKSFTLISNQLRKSQNKSLLYDGELMPTGIVNGNVIDYRFLGPGTNISKRLNQNPVNSLDAISKTHDIEYHNASSLPENQRATAIHLADQKWLKAFDSNPEMKNLPFGNISKTMILGKHSLEQILSLIKQQATTVYGT